MTALPNPLDVYEGIKDAYLRYIDTAFYLRSEELMDERRRRLMDSELLFTDVLLEPVLPYDSTRDLLEATRGVGLSDQAANLVGQALFGEYTEPGQPILLRKHQAEAVLHSLKPGLEAARNVVVTSGTGSGKTESFLLPVLARIVEELGVDQPQPAPVEWWSHRNMPWTSSRSSETRTAAMRSIVLYPTNALVEDQITRLRSAVRAIRSEGGLSLIHI